MSKKGFTLVEVMVSVAIVGLVLTGVLFLFVQTADISARIDKQYVATNLAKSRIERVRAVVEASGFDSLDDLVESSATYLNSDGTSNQNGDFKRFTAVSSYPSVTPDPNLRGVEVKVVYRYRGSWREDAAITVTTVFANVL